MSDSAAKHRAKQTVNNLLLSLLATSGLVLVLVLIVPRDDSSRHQPVDFASVAASTEAATSNQLFEPDLPTNWWANAARWSPGTDGVDTWYLGLVGPENQFISVKQAFNHNPTWLALETAGYVPDTASTVDNPAWLKLTKLEDVKGDPTIWVIEREKQAFILKGTATADEFSIIATQIENEFDLG